MVSVSSTSADGTVTTTQEFDPNLVPSGFTAVGVFETLDATQQAVFDNPSQYLYLNGEFVVQPYFTIASTASTTANEYTVTATLNNPPTTPPTTVNFTVAGTAFTETLTSGQASMTLLVHPSVASQSVSVSVTATSCVSASVKVCGTESTATIQAYQPSGSTTVNVAPTSKSYLESYYASVLNVQTLLADIGTAIGLLMHTMHNVVIPALQQTTWAPISLSADEANAHSSIVSSVLPNIFTTLANAYPSGGNMSVQYARYVQDQAAGYNSFADYVRDLSEIPNLVA